MRSSLLFIGLLLPLSCFFCQFALAQEAEAVQDSIKAARVVASRPIDKGAGTRILSLPDIRRMVSATGEADAIKYIQALPGVSTGAEGSSAIYVRGGNLGSNVTTLDGVPIYGGSHLLGLTSSYPSGIVSSAVFRNGGFRGSDNNLTASHIALNTGDGLLSGQRWSLSASNFLLSGLCSMPLVKDKISLIASIRISPIGPEFNAARSLIGGALDSLSHVRAFVYDAFAKATWRLNGTHTLSFCVFNSADAYRYIYGGDSDESMSWNNLIISARGESLLKSAWRLETQLSFNRFSSSQGIIRDMSGTINNLALINSLEEITARADFVRSHMKEREFRTGIISRAALFNPGTSSTFTGERAWMTLDSPRTDNRAWCFTNTLYAQVDLERANHYELMACAKLNANVSNSDEDRVFRARVNPEVSLLGRINLTPWLSVEATADWAVQYYHTLEGIPLGWSLDMIVPTDSERKPEQAFQTYGAILWESGKHHLSLGAYWKKMHNLVWFIDAGQLFSPAISGWKDNISVGVGSSKGMEFLYEKTGDRLSYKLAYTWSRTDRSFPRINKGEPFPAKFDRRHILNVQATYIIATNTRRDVGITGLFTFQSGHWETVPDGEYLAHLPLGGTFTLDYFSGGVNNYEMPPYSRLDLGFFFKFKGHHPQQLNIGIYNLLNRHNPFSITYDERSGQWRQISLLPIMPSICYSIDF